MRRQRIESCLVEHFPKQTLLEIIDESHQHAGRQGQESHFKVLLVSDDFSGQSRVQRQRKVNEILKTEFDQGLHALTMRLLTVEEYGKQQSAFQSPNCEGKKS